MNNPLIDPETGIPRDRRKNKDFRHYKCRVCLREKPREVKEMELAARDEESALQNLWDQGYVVVAIQDDERRKNPYPGLRGFFAAKSQGKGKPSAFGVLFQRVSNRELIFFAIQLSTLLKAGVPLVRALEVIRKGAVNPAFQNSIDALKNKVSSGTSLHQALRAQAKIFPWIWINLVEVGESTGKLPESLEEIARYQESAARIKGKVITAFFYPGILTLAVCLAMTFLLIFIVPKFSAIFEAQHLKLPPLTQVVVAVSNIVRFNFIPMAIVIAALIGGVMYAGRLPGVAIAFDAFRLGAPVFGPLLLQVSVVRFCRSLCTLLRSGVQILQALDISGKLLENKFLRLKIQQVSMAVRSGQGLGVQLEARHIFPVFMTQLLMVGEESGELERFLELLANYYEEQVDQFLSRLTVLMEPVLLIFMGGVIGTVVVSMFLPIIELSTQAGGG